MITVTFECGHSRTTSGSETTPTCACGESKITRVDAPAPTFRGHARGPHAEYVDLPAKAVTFGKEKEE